MSAQEAREEPFELRLNFYRVLVVKLALLYRILVQKRTSITRENAANFKAEG